MRRTPFTYFLLLVICMAGLSVLPSSAQTNIDKTNLTVTDIDGNVYKFVTIGTQVWMAENLKTTRFADGTPITEVEDSIAWANIYTQRKVQPAWCYYGNEEKHNPAFGKLYNWFAVSSTKKICPAGWHVPSDAEWTKLIAFLGGEKVAGNTLKSLNYWAPPNSGATNSSSFSALPGGMKYGYYGFNLMGKYAYYWTSTPNIPGTAWFRNLSSQFPIVGRNYGYTVSGLSVRCIMDGP